MSLNRYTTQPQFRGFEGGMKQLLDQFFTPETDDQSNVVTSQWQPRVDIKEEPKRFVIAADIPGVDPKDIEIHMDKGVLTLKGERSAETRSEDGKFTRVERVHGSFHRRFALPDTADAEQISASGKHGVLEIVIPKKADAAPRRIAINS
ncbi:MAG TPA: Hsp20/alpha crystallin family protein [Pseudomonadota bacterium]|nr:Hsp20/alpha crystallin family protein [Rhodanobacteraceae bacterium]MBP9155239.1 Hsp20/alpha crystallin family protein [Xanthomonadales bacterium]HQW81869.1 Hsp20/alpha crystallin family protein [Pseudomonadota bacterium]